MMNLINCLEEKWKDIDTPFLITSNGELRFSDIRSMSTSDLSTVKNGDVVALIGDLNAPTIATLLRLIDQKTVIVPLTMETEKDHQYFFETAYVNLIIKDGKITRRHHIEPTHPLINHLRDIGHAGLVLFSTGTTGRPKAILHDMTKFMQKYETPRPTLRTLNFLLFDHIGGINTLFHTMFNKGVVISPLARTVSSILDTCSRYHVELLPTTPTFLRMMLMSGEIPDKIPSCLKIITYGTERMEQPTLDELCNLLPNIEFRQTYGMSEIGIVRVKSESRNSLFMKIGGEGVETKVIDGVLHIKSPSRMLGYLNAESPFDKENWYNTSDIVECKGDLIKVVGRVSDVINVGGLKFMPSEVESIVLHFNGVYQAKAFGKSNPITGQHVELIVEPVYGKSIDKEALKIYLKEQLRPNMIPKRITIGSIDIGHRFKRL